MRTLQPAMMLVAASLSLVTAGCEGPGAEARNVVLQVTGMMKSKSGAT